MRNKRILFPLLLVFSLLCYIARAQEPFTVDSLPVKGLGSYDLTVSPDGKTAAVYAGQTALNFLNIPVIEYQVDIRLLPIRLMDLTTGDEVATLTGQTDYVTDVAFTPDGTQLATYHRNGDLILWDVASGQKAQQFTGIAGSGQLKFLPDGQTLVVYMADAQIGHFFVWDLATGSITQVWRKPYQSFGEITLSTVPDNLNDRYTGFDVSPDGAWLATATPNGEVTLWDTATMKQTLVQPKAEKPAPFNVRQVVFSTDGSSLVYYDTLTKQTHFWEIATQTDSATLDLGSSFFGVSPDGSQLAWATREDVWVAPVAMPDAAVKVLDFADGLLAAAPTVTFTPDGSQLIVGGFGSSGESDSLIYKVILNE